MVQLASILEMARRLEESKEPAESVRVTENNINGTEYVGFKAPEAVTTSLEWVLPSADAVGALTSDGAGTLSLEGGSTKFWDDAGDNYVEFSAPSVLTSNTTWTLPSGDGTSGQYMSTDGAGTLAWSTITFTHNGVSWTAPASDGTSGDFLSTDGAGNASWVTPTAAATQAEQETATSTTVYVTPGRQQYHPSAAKGWVDIDGTGTLAVDASYNVTSVSDLGTGNYQINWATDFSSASYSVTSMVDDGAGVAQTVMHTARAAGTTTLQCMTSATDTAVDADPVLCTAFGDQ